MRISLIALSLLTLSCSVALAQSTVSFTINTQQDVKPISQFIYGANYDVNRDFIPQFSNLTSVKIGGDRITAYNWENNASNAGSDWYYQNDAYFGSSNTPGAAMGAVIQMRSNHNAATIISIPMAGYVSADKLGNGDVRYVNGNSAYPDPNYLSTRFKVSLPAKNAPFTLTPDPNDGYVYQDEFVNWVKTNYPYAQTDPNRPIWFSLDNEPDIWSSIHAEIHPSPTTYAELVQKTIAYSSAIKNVMPNTLVFGPENYGFLGIWNLQNAPDANGRDFETYFLQQMAQAEQTYGKRLLDVLDVHWYPEVTGKDKNGNDVRITSQNSDPGVVAALAGPAFVMGPDLYGKQLDHCSVVHQRPGETPSDLTREDQHLLSRHETLDQRIQLRRWR